MTNSVVEKSFWQDAYYRLKKDRVAVLCFWVVALYALAQILIVLAIAYPIVSFGVYLDDKGTSQYQTWDL